MLTALKFTCTITVRLFTFIKILTVFYRLCKRKLTGTWSQITTACYSCVFAKHNYSVLIRVFVCVSLHVCVCVCAHACVCVPVCMCVGISMCVCVFAR